jgi:hypothetical protein
MPVTSMLWPSRFAGAAAVTLDAFSSLDVDTAATPWTTISHTQGSTANYTLIGVMWEENVTMGVTYGGVTMNAGSKLTGNGTNQCVQFFWLAASSMGGSGSKAIVVTPSGSASGMVAVWTLTGAAQGAPNRTSTEAANSGSTSAVSLASVPAGAFIASIDDNNDNSPVPTVAGADTLRHTNSIGSPQFHSCAASDSFPVVSATVTHTYTLGSSVRHATIMAEILAA